MFNVWSDKWDTFSYAPVNVVSRSMYVLNVKEHHKVKWTFNQYSIMYRFLTTLEYNLQWKV